MLSPQNIKYQKHFKGKLRGTAVRGTTIVHGKYAIRVLEEVRLSSQQIESLRRCILQKMQKSGFLWIRAFPDIPVTKKPTETRMGRGKGEISLWVAKLKKGQIICEISDISIEHAKRILKAGSKKLPIKTKIIWK